MNQTDADHTTISRDRYDAVLFDLDGVLTSTAALHAACWKQMFDAFLDERRRQGAQSGEDLRPFDVATDYKLYVDGKPRYEGTASFLESRGIHLPHGTSADAPGAMTVCGLGNLKDDLVKQAIDAGQVQPFEGSVRLVRHLREQGYKTGVVSSSRNCAMVLKAAGIDTLFETRVDGMTAEALNLPGKPKPDTFLEAARNLGVDPARAVVVEDAISGVQAGRAGRFGLVIGVDREGAEGDAAAGTADALRANGADVVVHDLGELLPGERV